MEPSGIRAEQGQFEELTQKPVYWVGHRDSKANHVLYILVFALWYDIFFEKKCYEEGPGKLSAFIYSV